MKRLIITTLLIIFFLAYLNLSAQEGFTCENAVPVDSGTYSVPNLPYWYSFAIPDNDLKITISSVDLTTEDTYLEVFYKCDSSFIAANDDYSDLQSQVSLSGLPKGDTIFIHWNDQFTDQPFQWSLSIDSLSDSDRGSECTLSIEATLGNNTLPPVAIESDYKIIWYSFTMTEDSSKIVVTSDTDVYVGGLTGDCGYFRDIYDGFGNVTITNVEPGEEVHIAWVFEENHPGFDWNLSIEPIGPGESCKTAIVAHNGINSLPDNNGNYWYTFVVPQDSSKLTISTSNDNSYYTVYGGNCNNLSYLTSGSSMYHNPIYNLSKGDTILIEWDIYVSDNNSQWEISVDKIGPGEFCEDPLEISEGNYTLDQAPFWYKFTVPEDDRKIVIESQGLESLAELRILRSCSGEVLSYVYGDQNNEIHIELEKLIAGETILIHWMNYYGSGELNWSIQSKGYSELMTEPKSMEFTIPPNSESNQNIFILNAGDDDLEYSIGQSQGIRFINSYDNVYIPDQLNELLPRNEISISLWLYVGGLYSCPNRDTWSPIISYGSLNSDSLGYHVILEKDRTLTWIIGTENGVVKLHSQTELPYQTSHLSFTYSNIEKEAKIYINGEDVSGTYLSNQFGQILPNYDNALILPNWRNDACEEGRLSKVLDELVIWDHQRSNNEINSDINTSYRGNEKGLLGYWNFEHLRINEEYGYGQIFDSGPHQLDGYTNGVKPSASITSTWLSISRSVNSVSPLKFNEVTITINSEDLETGSFDSELIIFSNDPDKSFEIIPMNITVTNPLNNGYAKQNILSQNYPNPFSAVTTIEYSLENTSRIQIQVFDLQGREVCQLLNQVKGEGVHQVTWNGLDSSGKQLPNGIYIYRLTQDNGTSQTKKLVIRR